HILHVMEDEENPCFSYSIGIQKVSNQSEIIITGLKFELTHSIINNYNNQIKLGKSFKTDTFYSGFLENFDVMFKNVNKIYFKEYFGWARWLYKGDNFNALQLIYPDVDGIWPWQENASTDFKWFIPNLYD
ncbi:DUF4262 domain-containing protein, partial [Leptospira terpstrae]